MSNIDKLLKSDLKHVFHPCTQMKDFEKHPPLIVNKAEGSYLYTDRGPIIDAISSWWCKSLGHGHPEITKAINTQLNQFEHVIVADTTYPNIVSLAEELEKISGLQHTFFASDGSSAVEIALKLAIHASQLKGSPHRKEFISLKNSYHGETLATLSISDLDTFKKPYQDFGLTCHFLQNIPYVTNMEDPLWHNCDEIWSKTLEELELIKKSVCALIVEPIVQGANGMRIYSADFLARLANWAKANDIYLIADEIMTGFGRTGKWLASNHANIKPDLICISKGLTGGSLPLSCVLIDNQIYSLFYNDYNIDNSFLHSHTYSGNPLAVAAALATIKAMQKENIISKSEELGNCMKEHFTNVAKLSGKISNVRYISGIIAGDLENHTNKRIGYDLQQAAIKNGALLRPIGRTLYWLPPLNTSHQTIEKLAEITLKSIKDVYSL